VIQKAIIKKADDNTSALGEEKLKEELYGGC